MILMTTSAKAEDAAPDNPPNAPATQPTIDDRISALEMNFSEIAGALDSFEKSLEALKDLINQVLDAIKLVSDVGQQPETTIEKAPSPPASPQAALPRSDFAAEAYAVHGDAFDALKRRSGTDRSAYVLANAEAILRAAIARAHH